MIRKEESLIRTVVTNTAGAGIFYRDGILNSPNVHRCGVRRSALKTTPNDGGKCTASGMKIRGKCSVGRNIESRRG